MRNKLVYKYLGKVLIVLSFLIIIPIIVSFALNENILPFLIPLLISLVLGTLLSNIKTENKNLYAKDGFVIV